MADKQILFHSEAREKVRRGATILAKAIRVTLRPKSKSVLFQKHFGTPTICNDGVSIAKDEDAAVVQAQYFEGTVSEFEVADWQKSVVAEIAPPKDLTGAFDDLIADNFGDTERPRRPEDWDGPWNELDDDA